MCKEESAGGVLCWRERRCQEIEDPKAGNKKERGKGVKIQVGQETADPTICSLRWKLVLFHFLKVVPFHLVLSLDVNDNHKL